MKAILEFDLNDPDDERFHAKCISAPLAYIALWEIKQLMRSAVHHNSLPGFRGDMEASADVISFLQSALLEIMGDHGINNLIDGN